LTELQGLIYQQHVDDVDRTLARVKRDANGLMPLRVYRRIYESAAKCGGGTLVEIGTYCGAATVALALGAKASGHAARIITADLLRADVGLAGTFIETKVGNLQRTFDAFGVSDFIEFVHGSAHDILATKDPSGVALLLLDGGGKIEEDLALFYSRLRTTCLIIVDDIDGRTFVHREGKMALVDQKHRLSKLLADRFVAAGLMRPCGEVASAGWYEKGDAEMSPDAIRLLALPCYHELVKAQIERSEFGWSRATLRRLAARFPWAARAYRRIFQAPEPVSEASYRTEPDSARSVAPL
jgi:predicted O-methyltransferase YrrM